MKRVHVLEFEDLAWFPAWLRTLMTNLIVVLNRVMGVTEVLADLVSRVLKEQQLDRVVDLGSGSGGVMPDVIARVRADPQTTGASLILTDLYPNADALGNFNRGDSPHIVYWREPVNAKDFESVPAGLKTMINSFHHMRPQQARAILDSARRNRQPLLIYEMAENRIPFVVWCLALPISLTLVAAMALLLTPMVRPLTVRQLVFTYVIPVVPLFFAWDGQASMQRLYTFDDLDELLRGMSSTGYRWEKGVAKTQTGAKRGTYLLGVPC